MLGFRLWYADGTVVTGSTLAEFKAAPATGFVQAYRYGPGYKARFKGDWLWWQDDDLRCTPASGPGQPRHPRPDVSCEGCAKEGVLVSDEQYAAIEAAGRASTWP